MQLKRFLVRNWFGWRELVAALRGVRGQPPIRIAEPDYDRYWEERGPGGLHPRFDIIARALEPGATLLDVGCGDGAMLEWLAGERGVRGLGIDLSAVAVERARARGVEARVAEIGALAAERGAGAFDHVVLSEVIEHVPDPERLVRVARGLARRAVWLTIPNIAYLPHRLRLLAGKFPVQWAVFPGEHLRFWSIPDFVHWLDALGIRAAEIVPSNGITVLEAHRMWPNLLANQIVVRIDP